MSILEAILLGIVQGITEFLPISSSGHLILAETALGLEVSELVEFDVAVHVATLVAILVYFKADIIELLKTFFKFDFKSEKGKEITYLIIGTIPIVVVGFLWGDQIIDYFRDTAKVGVLMIIVAIYFLIAETIVKRRGFSNKMTLAKAVLIGLAQTAALLPGVSRSGSTIATAMIAGQNRIKSARFSFLLGSIAITGAGILLTSDLVGNGGLSNITTTPLVFGFVSSIVASYLTITFLMRFLRNNKLSVFAYYLMAIGLITIALS